MENNIPTAEEFLQYHLEISYFYDDKTEKVVCYSDEVQQAMIEFAKLHVEAALKEASENADMDNEYYQSVQEGTTGGIDIETILNAYPLTNIK
jgi:hypothetical protein